MAKQHVCTNCKYFKRHYIIGEGKLISTCAGHCVHLKIRDNVSDKHVKKDEWCELWQPFELQKLEEQYNMELRLEKISKAVGEMLMVLRDVE